MKQRSRLLDDLCKLFLAGFGVGESLHTGVLIVLNSWIASEKTQKTGQVLYRLQLFCGALQDTAEQVSQRRQAVLRRQLVKLNLFLLQVVEGKAQGGPAAPSGIKVKSEGFLRDVQMLQDMGFRFQYGAGDGFHFR